MRSWSSQFPPPPIRLGNTQRLISSTKVTISSRNTVVFPLSTAWFPKNIHGATKVTENRDVCWWPVRQGSLQIMREPPKAHLNLVTNTTLMEKYGLRVPSSLAASVPGGKQCLRSCCTNVTINRPAQSDLPSTGKMVVISSQAGPRRRKTGADSRASLVQRSSCLLLGSPEMEDRDSGLRVACEASHSHPCNQSPWGCCNVFYLLLRLWGNVEWSCTNRFWPRVSLASLTTIGFSYSTRS